MFELVPMTRSPVMRAIIVGVVVVLVAAVGFLFYSVRDSDRVNAAIRAGDLDAMNAALDRRPDLLERRPHYGVTPLLADAERGQAGMVAELARRGADVNARLRIVSSNDGDWTALHIGARAGNLRVAKVLIQAGADVNARSRSGDTPLDFARQAGHLDVAELLAAHGGQPGRR